MRKRRKLSNSLATGFTALMLLLSALFLLVFLIRMFEQGARVLSWEFIFSAPATPCVRVASIQP